MNYVFFIDGSGQRIVSPAKNSSSNVCKLWNKCLDDKDKQILFSHDGPGAVFPLMGRLIGLDSNKILIRLYQEFAQNFKLQQRQKLAVESKRNRLSKTRISILESPVKIYLFGFSRGAYIARMLAHIISVCGVPRDAKIAKSVFSSWRKGPAGMQALVNFRREKILSEPIDVEYMGLWDSVRAKIRKVKNTDYYFLCKGILECRHAIAANEYRARFSVDRIYSEHAKEMVFPGAHSDVGGGYKHYQAIANVSLAWVANGAIRRGLLLKEQRFLSEELDLNQAMIHNSMLDRMGAFSWRMRRRYLWGIPRHNIMQYYKEIRRERLIRKFLDEDHENADTDNYSNKRGAVVTIMLEDQKLR